MRPAKAPARFPLCGESALAGTSRSRWKASSAGLYRGGRCAPQPEVSGMSGAVDELLFRLRRGAGVLVRVEATEGSAPREAGTWMAVWPDAITGTIGGGQLEFEAIQRAREWLSGGAAV